MSYSVADAKCALVSSTHTVNITTNANGASMFYLLPEGFSNEIGVKNGADLVVTSGGGTATLSSLPTDAAISTSRNIIA